MSRLRLNRLWVQFSLVIAGVVLVAAVALVAATYSLRPEEPADRPPPAEVATGESATVEPPNPFLGFVRFATQSVLVLITTGTALGIGAGIWMSRRMTAPLEELANGTKRIGAGERQQRAARGRRASVVIAATGRSRQRDRAAYRSQPNEIEQISTVYSDHGSLHGVPLVSRTHIRQA